MRKMTPKGLKRGKPIGGDDALTAHLTQQHQLLTSELKEFKTSQSQPSTKQPAVVDQTSNKILGYMDHYYTHMKGDIGIDPDYAPDQDDVELNQVLLNLKHNAQPNNFKEFLKRADNFDRNTPWKQISRKIDAVDHK